jgi:chromosome segregation ATPase
MTNPVKPSKWITKLIESGKAQTARIKELEAKLAQSASDAQGAIDAAVEQTRIDYQGRLDELKAHHDADWAESERRFNVLIESAVALKTQLETAQADLRAGFEENKRLSAELAEVRTNRDYIQSQLDAIQPELALIYSQREELTEALRQGPRADERARTPRRAGDPQPQGHRSSRARAQSTLIESQRDHHPLHQLVHRARHDGTVDAAARIDGSGPGGHASEPRDLDHRRSERG